MFNDAAPLEEEGARAVLPDGGDGEGEVGGWGDHDQEERARALGVEGEGEQLNMVSFKASQRKADIKRRDEGHEAAIFGSGPAGAGAGAGKGSAARSGAAADGAGNGTAGGGSRHGGGAEEGRGGDQKDQKDQEEEEEEQAAIRRVLAKAGAGDEDGPVVVMDTEALIGFGSGQAAAPPSQGLGSNSLHSRSGAGLGAQGGRGGQARVSEAVAAGHQALSWRERAMQARAAKAAAAPPVPAAAEPAQEAEGVGGGEDGGTERAGRGHAGGGDRHGAGGAAEGRGGEPQAAQVVSLQLSWRDKARNRKAAKLAS